MTDALLPPEVLANVNDVDKALQKVEEQLSKVLPDCTREAMDQLTSLERASTFMMLSKTLNTLFCLYLKTNGLSPDKQSAQSELERANIYQEKLQLALGRSKGPQRPSTRVDISAANRFIEHAVADLPEDQRKQLREVGKKGNAKRQQERVSVAVTPKKRASGLSIAEEAAAFLAEASKEIKKVNVES